MPRNQVFQDLDNIETEVKRERTTIEEEYNCLKKLESIKTKIEMSLQSQRDYILSLIEGSKRIEEKIRQEQALIVQKIQSCHGDIDSKISESEKLYSHFEKYYLELEEMNKIFTQLDLDMSLLKVELNMLIKKSRIIDLHSSSADLQSKVDDIMDKFYRVEEQKKNFENKLKELNLVQQSLL
jgi:hypothetical protein